jgi:large subunit ribosomal protein L30
MSKVRVKQVRSHIGRDPRVIATLKAIGLGAVGKSKVLTVNDAVNGMIKKVEYLLKVEPVK